MKIYVSGMTCQACDYKIKYLFSGIEGVQTVSVNRADNEVFLETSTTIERRTIEEVLRPFPKYTLIDTPIFSMPITNDLATTQSLYPLYLISIFITGVAIATSFDKNIFELQNFSTQVFLHNFMTGFFLVFSFFKLLNIKSFAESFAMYDLIAMRFALYGKIYPFIELTLGVLCLLNYEPRMIYIAEILIMSLGTIGVVQSVMNKRKIRCACLGSVFNLPMTTVTIIENSIMIAVGLLLLTF